MKFLRGEFVTLAILLCPVAAWLVWSAHHRMRRMAAWWGPAGGRAAGSWNLPSVGLGLKGLALVLSVAALAGPVTGERKIQVPRRGVEILLALDISRSMLSADPAPSRLQWAKREIGDFLDKLPGARVGLVTFAGTAFLQCPFTTDRETLRLFLDRITPEFLPVGGSSIGAALKAALGAFDPASTADRAIVLVSDGEATSAGIDDAGTEAKKQGVRIFALGIGSTEGAPVPAPGGGFTRDARDRIVISKLDESALRSLAEKTGGYYVHRRADDEDTEALVERSRATLADAVLTARVRIIPEDRYQWLLGPAVFLWLLGSLADRRRSAAVPVAGAAALTLLLATLFAPTDARAKTFGSIVREAREAYGKNDFAAAAERYGEAAAKRPDDPRVRFNGAVADYQAGRFDRAARGFEGIVGAGNNERYQESRAFQESAWYNLGNARYRAGDLDGAVEAYTKALELDPADEDARRNLEFVKKKIEEMRQNQQNNRDNKDREKNDEQKGDEKTSAGKGGEKSAGNREEQKSGSETTSRKEQEKDGPSSSGTDEEQQGENANANHNPASGTDDMKPGETAGAGDSGERSEEAREAAQRLFGGEAGRRRAEALLERLQDQPGKALMPRYEKRRVEKDW